MSNAAFFAHSRHLLAMACGPFSARNSAVIPVIYSLHLKGYSGWNRRGYTLSAGAVAPRIQAK
jgi:hypothetical protein